MVPWYVLGDDEKDDAPFIEIAAGKLGDESHQSIAYVQAEFTKDDTFVLTDAVRDHARLIAAAPELLAALKGASDMITLLMAAGRIEIKGPKDRDAIKDIRDAIFAAIAKAEAAP